MNIEQEIHKLNNANHLIKTYVAWITTFILCVASVYMVWGWVTIEDIRKYCAAKDLDFEDTLSALVPNTTIGSLEGNEKGYTVKDIHSGSTIPIYRYIIPFNFQTVGKDGFSFTTGGILEPFLAISENSRNLIFCFGIGHIVGILVLGLESLKGNSISILRLLLRPISA